ncbi:MAG: alkaline phosphatase D family protein [Proteobacteria bacterium]|nr:alkaline phosphatase D family protein [Pseudomonadota bacterium]
MLRTFSASICVGTYISIWSTLLFAGAAHGIEISHGVASGDVTDSSAVVWSRADAAATMRVTYGPAIGTTEPQTVEAVAAANVDFTAQVLLTSLTADTLYRYEVEFVAGRNKSGVVAGVFRTAPARETAQTVTLIWSGDLAGQRYCRRPGIGYRIFTPMRNFRPDFFVANGDMIYADNDCPAQGIEPGWQNVPASFPGIGDPAVNWQEPAELEEVFNAHWRYNRADQQFQTFLASVPMYAQWDDHEVINDFGAPWQTYAPQPDRMGYPNVVAAGRKSFWAYHPFDPNATTEADGSRRIYRSYRWGAHLELFILDARSYRSANTDADSSAKTMLGSVQLEWLKAGLAASDATWKIISNDVPLSVPTGSRADEFGRDAFASGDLASGFETELLDLVRHIDAHNVRNVVFIATDVHSAAQLRYERDYDGDGDPLLFHELIAGPLSAIKGPAPVSLDPTLGPVMLYAEGALFNYGTITVSTAHAGQLRADIRDESGDVRPGSELKLDPR